MKYCILVLLLTFGLCELQAHKITVIGTGYVGLVLGVGLASMNHDVICADIEKHKIEQLNNTILPIYEKGLEELLKTARNKNKISFTTNINHAIQESDVIFIAVGTPAKKCGQTDLSAVNAVVRTIAENLNAYKIICIKSTLPVGCCSAIKTILENSTTKEFDILFNPEFLREGSAVEDFFNPDRIVLGTESEKATTVFKEIFEPLVQKAPLLLTNFATAEMIKYASNAFLASKISFINEIATLCEATNADVAAVAQGIGLDPRIGQAFLKPGPGFGGSCFPKDVLALLNIAKRHAVDLKMVQACFDTNEQQKQRVIEKLLNHFDYNVMDKKIALLGVAFKANTDDVRCSPAIPLIEKLTLEGACINVFDIQAMKNMQKDYPSLRYCSSMTEAIQDVDAIVIMTEWDEFKNLNLEDIQALNPNIFILDARNILNTDHLKKLNIAYRNIGNASIS